MTTTDRLIAATVKALDAHRAGIDALCPSVIQMTVKLHGKKPEVAIRPEGYWRDVDDK